MKRMFLPLSIAIGALLVSQATSAFGQTAKVDAFKAFLSTNGPIKRLRFTVIPCKNGDQRKYIAAVDHENFFIREYGVGENTAELINTNNRPRHLFFGRFGDEYWQIMELEITKTSATNAKVNVYQANAEVFKGMINNVLNLGVRNVKPGSFIWKGTSRDGKKSGFEAALNDTVELRNSKGTSLKTLPGYMTISDGVVSQLYGFGNVKYEYASNSSIPEGLPTKIIIGNSASDCDDIYVIEELVYGKSDDPAKLFKPENKFVSTNIVSIVFVANETRTVVSPGLEISPPAPFREPGRQEPASPK